MILSALKLETELKLDDVLLREASKEDIVSLVTVIHAAFEEYREKLDPPSGAHNETTETVRQKMIDDCAVLAEVNYEIVGCVFYRLESDHLYLYRLSVHPAYRRQGIGHALVKWIEDKARALKLPRVRLSVRLALPANQAYYERLGYCVINYGTHAGYSAPTFMTMEKPLNPSSV